MRHIYFTFKEWFCWHFGQPSNIFGIQPFVRTTTIRNVYNWRVKETERMVAIVTELRKLGATVEEGRDYCVITPPKKVSLFVWSNAWDLSGRQSSLCFHEAHEWW